MTLPRCSRWLCLMLLPALLLVAQAPPAPAPSLPPVPPPAPPVPPPAAPTARPTPPINGQAPPAPAPEPTKGDDGPVIPRKPNIVFIMADDMGRSDLGVYGQQVIATPHIDQLAKDGMRFTNAYAGSTVCAPSRSVLMTGLHMGHTPVRSNPGGTYLRESDYTVAQVLKSAGYTCGGFGKWGLGDVGTPGAPEKHGFDVFLGYYHQVHAHYFYPSFLYRNSQRVMLPGNAGFYGVDPQTDKSAARFPAGAYPSTDPKTGLKRQFTQYLIVEETLRFIRENKDRPFFVYAPWTPPHGMYHMPEEDPAWQAVKDKPWPVQAKVTAAMVGMVDRQVGEVVSLLKELGLEERTIVFFASDNGAAQRLEGVLDSTGHLRGQKTTLYEGGLRVPLIVRWPGQIDPGTASDHLTGFVDMMPTLADLADAGPQIPVKVDGYSLLPTLLGKSRLPTRTQATHDYLYWEHLTRWDDVKGEKMAQAVRMGQWKAVKNVGKPVELYDLSVDESESNDVAGDHPHVLEMVSSVMRVAHKPMPPQIEPEKPEGHRWR